MSVGRGLYGGGTVFGWRGLGRGWSPRSEQAIVCIATPPLGLSLRGRPHYKPASGQGQGQEGGYSQQSCVVQHLLYPGDEGRAASAQRLGTRALVLRVHYGTLKTPIHFRGTKHHQILGSFGL